MGREALLSAFLVGAGSSVRELGVKVTVPPTPPPLTPPPQTQAWAKLGLGAAQCGTQQVPSLAGQRAWRGQGGVTTWSPGTPLSPLCQGTWYRAVGRLLLGASKNRKLGHEDLQSGPSGTVQASGDLCRIPPAATLEPGPHVSPGGAGHLPGRKRRDISGYPDKSLCILGRGEVPPLTSPDRGLRHLDKALPLSALLAVSLRLSEGNHRLGLGGRTGRAPSTLHVCFQSKKKPVSQAGNAYHPPFLCFSPPPPPSPNPKSFQSDNMWAQIKPLSSGPCWHVSRLAHLPPPAPQLGHPPHPCPRHSSLWTAC